ncbi:MAG: TolC family protein, partial [Vampirovibrionia bacterium]
FFCKVLLCFLFGLFSIVGVSAEEINLDNSTHQVRVMSLPECINLSMQSSPVVNEAKEDIEVSRAKLAEARSGYMPRVNARVSYSYFNTNNIIKTALSDNIVGVLSQNAVYQGLTSAAMQAGINPLTGQPVTEMDVITALAARNRTTPTALFDAMTQRATQTMIDNRDNILWTPIHGNNLFQTEVNLRQPIFLWGKVYNLNKQAKAGIGASRSEFVSVKNDVTFEVVERYNQVLLAKDGLDLAKETELKFSTLRDLIEALYKGEAENVTKLDYLEVEAYLGLVKAKVNELEKNLSLAKAALKNSIGIDGDVEVDTAENTQSYQFIDVNLEDSIQKAMLNRPEFNKLDFGIQAKKHEIKATRADNRPKVILDSAFDVNVDNKNYMEPDPVDFRLSVIADIPLFDGLQTRAKVNQRKHELGQLKEKQRQLTNGVRLQVIDAVLSVIEAEKTLKATEEAANAATENQSLARQSFELEIVESQKVIDAQVLEAKVKTQRLLSIFNYNVAKAKLKKVMGTIDSVSSADVFDIMDLNIDSLQEKPSTQRNLLDERPESIL